MSYSHSCSKGIEDVNSKGRKMGRRVRKLYVRGWIV